MGISPLVLSRWGGGRPEWQRLFSLTDGATAYVSPEWVYCWLREFGDELQSRQLVFYNDEESALGTCLLTERTSYRAVLPFVRGYLNTDGENASDRVVVEHNMPLAAPREASEVWRQLSAYVRRSGMDEFVVAGATEATVDLAIRSFQGWNVQVEWRDSPFVDLEKLRREGIDHAASLSANTRSQLRRALRRYEARGVLRTEVATTTGQALEMFEQLLSLHEQRWQRRGEVGGFATTHRRAFHRSFILEAHGDGRAQLVRVMNGESVLGVLYNLVANGHVAFYQSGFQYDNDPRLKPGMVTHHLAICYYLASGYREYDFLPSGQDEGRYKLSLGNSCRRLGTITLSRPGWRSRYFGMLRMMRRSVGRAIQGP